MWIAIFSQLFVFTLYYAGCILEVDTPDTLPLDLLSSLDSLPDIVVVLARDEEAREKKEKERIEKQKKASRDAKKREKHAKEKEVRDAKDKQRFENEKQRLLKQGKSKEAELMDKKRMDREKRYENLVEKRTGVKAEDAAGSKDSEEGEWVNMCVGLCF